MSLEKLDELGLRFGIGFAKEIILWLIGFACLLLATSGSLLLVLHHFDVVTLPGCLPGSGCDATLRVTGSHFLGWPASFFGLAFFVALFATWFPTIGRGVSLLYRIVTRLGALTSVVSLFLLLSGTGWCGYCVLIHLANLGFWIVVERFPRACEFTPLAHVTLLTSFVVVIAVLNVVVSEQDNRSRSRTVQVTPSPITTQTSNSKRENPTTASSDVPETQSNDDLADHLMQTLEKALDSQPTTKESLPKFSRQAHRKGSPAASNRLVVFFDYADAKLSSVQRQLDQLESEFGDDISIEMRHFPMCQECNVFVDGDDGSNSCRAAYAAEAAAALHGEDGFWKMHRWLIKQRGEFSDDVLQKGLVALDYSDFDAFVAHMNSNDIKNALLADIVEAKSRRVSHAVTVLLNGQRLDLRSYEDSIVKAVDVMNTDAMPGKADIEDSIAGVSQVDDSAIDMFTAEVQQIAAGSTVRVSNDSDGTRSVGSGVVIADRKPFVYVLTAAHLVSNTRFVEVRLCLDDPATERKELDAFATVVARSETSDLALLRFVQNGISPRPLAIVPQKLFPKESGFAVLTVGFDEGQDQPSCVSTTISSTKRVRRPNDESTVVMWEVAKPSTAGRSGGPLLDQRGLVIGLASGISDGKGYFTHAEEIHRFLEQRDLHELIESESEVSQ